MSEIVIVGANRGIGLGFAHQYLKQDAHVTATYRDSATLDRLQEISDGVRVSLKRLQEIYPDKLSLYQLDVTKEEDISQFAKTVQKIDVLILNAGIKGYSISSTKPTDHFAQHPAKDHTSQHLTDALRVNTQAPDNIIRCFYPLLSTSEDACVVYMSSRIGSTSDNSNGGYHPYRIAKAASNMLIWNWSIALMSDWAKNGQPLERTPCAVAICPGWVRTDMGGPTAKLSIEESTSAMTSVISHVIKTKESNALYMYNGDVVGTRYEEPEVLKEIWKAHLATKV